MSAPKHTPGPWEADDALVYDASGGLVADVLYADEQGSADAALIAAAPELAEALRRMLAEHDDLWAKRPVAVRGDAQIGNAAHEALKKAGVLP